MNTNRHKEEQAIAFWGRKAGQYDRAMAGGRSFYQDIIRRAMAVLRPEDVLIEAACGSGQVCCALAPHVSQVWASDAAPQMVQTARAHAAQQGLKNISFSVQDAIALAYPAHSADAVLCLAALHLMPRADDAIQAFDRVLKPGGQLLLSSYLAGQSGMSRLGNALMSLNGYRDHHKWDEQGFIAFIEGHGYQVQERCFYSVFPIPLVYVRAVRMN